MFYVARGLTETIVMNPAIFSCFVVVFCCCLYFVVVCFVVFVVDSLRGGGGGGISMGIISVGNSHQGASSFVPLHGSKNGWVNCFSVLSYPIFS